MRYQPLLLFGLVLVVGVGSGCITLSPPKRTRPGQVIGVIDEPRSAALRITTMNKETRELHTDAKTRYIKWVTHQPWTVDKLVDAKALMIGRCVKVTLHEGDVHLARRVEVSLDGVGGLYDPCKSIR